MTGALTFRRRVLRLSFVYHSDLLEAHLGAMLALWGAWLSIPWYESLGAPAFAGVRALAPEWMWALWMLGLGLTQQYATLYEERNLRRAAAFAAVLHWMFLAVNVARVSPPSVGCVLFPILSISNLLCYLRLTFNEELRHAAA